MVWSENAGVSIVLPSDHVDGDGRNWIVIGEDVPPEVASAYTAALVFYSGAPPTNTYGFAYFCFGITNLGNLEVAIRRYILANPSDPTTIQWYNKTILNIASPVGVDKPPVLSLGDDPNYSSFHDGALDVVANGGIKHTDDGIYTMVAARNAYSISGVSPPPGATVRFQNGSAVVTTNASGDARIIFYDPFPNNIINAFAVPGDVAGGITSNVVFGYSKTYMDVRSFNANGALGNTTVRIEWFALGW